jgi:hypothetical protein
LVRYRWETILSSAQNASTPAKARAREWLRRKFSNDSEDDYERDGIVFETKQFVRRDKLEPSTNVGLVVFEAPLKTAKDGERKG